MAMSCVADENATNNASHATQASEACGSTMDMPTRPTAIPICASNIQPRR